MKTELATDLTEGSVFLAPVARKERATTTEARTVSWHEVRPGETAEPLTAQVLKFTVPTQPQRQEERPVAMAVEGTVIEVESASVLCSVKSGDRRVELRLLPAIFPDTPRFGMAFDLAMVTVAGVQQPRITLRQNLPADDELASKVDELLESLG